MKTSKIVLCYKSIDQQNQLFQVPLLFINIIV